MPQPTQYSLVCILLLWMTTISIIQVVFIALFFTQGHKDQPQNSSGLEPQHGMHSQNHSTPSPPPTDGLGKGAMLTLKGTAITDKTIRWRAVGQDQVLITEEDDRLKINKDGSYFLNLQVTLTSCGETYENRTVSLTQEVSGIEEVILEGWINPTTQSTGLLGKVQGLSAGDKLAVTIKPESRCLNSSESVTHLDMIYMFRPAVKLR